jgi:chromosomal replication initiator protein
VLAEQMELRVTAEILDWLAEHLTGGGRQLDGAIQQLKSPQGLQAKPLRLADIRAHFRTQIEAHAPTVKRIAEHVCGYYQIAPRRLLTARRSREVMLPRQVSMYLARQLTTQSLEQIGKYFGGRDHKTVQHAVRKVEAAMKEDAALSGAVRQLHAELA